MRTRTKDHKKKVFFFLSNNNNNNATHVNLKQKQYKKNSDNMIKR